MNTLAAEELLSELESVKPIPAIDARATTYPYGNLSSEHFELLMYELFKHSSPPGQERSWSNATIMIPGADAGRDITLYLDSEFVGIVQCKRHKHNIGLLSVFEEIAKCVLYPEVNKELPKVSSGLHYFLCLAGGPTKRVVEFFSQSTKMSSCCYADLETAVRSVLETYTQLEAIDEPDAIQMVCERIREIKLHLLRSEDVDAWLGEEGQIASRFFAHRHLVDSAVVEAQNERILAILDRVNERVDGVPFIADVDLNYIKGRIEDVPETHRLSFGFASLFGFPRDMFVGDAELKQMVTPLMTALNSVSRRYIEFMQELAKQEAQRICFLPEVLYSVHPFARQIVLSCLSLYTADISLRNLSGEVMTGIVGKTLKRNMFSNERECLEHVCQEYREQGSRYLQQDYSQVVGSGELLELKLSLIDALVKDIRDDNHLEEIIDKGRDILLPHLESACERMRARFSHRPSIFLMGSSGIDSNEVIARIGDTVRALEEQKKGEAQ